VCEDDLVVLEGLPCGRRLEIGDPPAFVDGYFEVLASFIVRARSDPRAEPAQRTVVMCSERRRAGQAAFERNSTHIVRAMFVLFLVLIVGGIVLFVTVGLTQQ
jgi:hypothetical protein